MYDKSILDGFINIVCFISIVQYYLSLNKEGIKSYLGYVTRILLLMASAITLIRSILFFSSSNLPILYSTLDLLRVFLPLIIALFIEALIKRHYPKAYKWSLVIITIVLLVGFVSGLNNWKTIYQLFLLLVIFLSAIFILLEKNKLNETDKDLLVGHLIAITLSIPFLGVEFFLYQNDTFISVSTASFSALIFVNVLAQLINEGSRPYNVFVNIFWYVVSSIIFVGILFLSFDIGKVNLFIDWFFITFSLHVAFGTNRIIRSYELKKKSSSFISWLIDKNKGFEHSLKLGRSYCPGLGDFIVLKGLELSHYNNDILLEYGEKFPNLINYSRIKILFEKQKIGPDSIEVVEQLIDILESYNMTDMFFLTLEPLQLMLMNIPQISAKQTVENKIQLMSRFAKMAEN